MALVDLPSAIVGAVVAGVVVAALLEMRFRATRNTQALQLTTAWRLSELGKPLLIARDVQVDVPRGSRVVASGLVETGVFSVAEVRQVPAVRLEAAIDVEGGRAMVFVAGVREGGMALVTTDPDLVSRIASEARAAWDRGDPYVERGTIGELVGRAGVNVETRGTVQEVLPYRDQYLMRLTHGGDMIGVLVPKDPASLVGLDVQVQGRLDRDRSGYPVIEATDVRRLR